jgi:hypothetical protein
MEPHARQPKPSFDPIIDTPEWRAEHKARMDAYVREMEAEHGALAPAKLAEVQAKLDAADAQVAASDA